MWCGQGCREREEPWPLEGTTRQSDSPEELGRAVALSGEDEALRASKMERPQCHQEAVVSQVYVEGASDAIAFCKRAVRAEELFRIAHPKGKILHAEMSICGQVVRHCGSRVRWVGMQDIVKRNMRNIRR
jgi:hypothetical protein